SPPSLLPYRLELVLQPPFVCCTSATTASRSYSGHPAAAPVEGPSGVEKLTGQKMTALDPQAPSELMVPASDVLSEQLTPRSAAQTLVGYQENHQIELFMQEMLGVVFAILPEDPFEYMTHHIALHRPAPPPTSDKELCGSAALWVLLRGGDALCPEHWRLRRCWLERGGAFCISESASSVTRSGSGLVIGSPADSTPRRVPLEAGSSYRSLDECEAARPFAFTITSGPDSSGQSLQLAAGSEEQRDEWFMLFKHFADPVMRKGPAPKSERILSPRVAPLPAAAQQAANLMQDIQMVEPPPGQASPAPTWSEPLKPPKLMTTGPSATSPLTTSATFPATRKGFISALDTNDEGGAMAPRPLKPCLKPRPPPAAAAAGPAVPAIRIPKRSGIQAMEAENSTRRTSIRFNDHVDKSVFEVARAEPVPVALRAHESRRKPGAQPKAVTRPPPAPAAAGFRPQPRSPRPAPEGTAVADEIGMVDLQGQAPSGVPKVPLALDQQQLSAAEPPTQGTSSGAVSREEAVSLAAKVLSDTVLAHGGGVSQRREREVKEMLSNLLDSLAGAEPQ
ncbi:unnamed protein product, partial [Prorocentrum cordatum]